MIIKFIKVARYGSVVSVAQKYQDYCLSTKQVSDPDISLPISYCGQHQENQYRQIYYSPLRRAKSSAEYLSNNVVLRDELREVKFNLAELVSFDEYVKFGSKLVRERFLQAFVQDKLLESRRVIIDRIRTLIIFLKQSKSSECVCVSHSFLMKIFEAYAGGVDLLREPGSLSDFIVPETKTYPYGGGFIIRVQSMRGEL